MRIIQVLPTLAWGDGIGNDCIALDHMLSENGYKTEIYAETIKGEFPSSCVRSINELSTTPEDIIIYHLSIGSELTFYIERWEGIKIVRYHNITPSLFFRAYDRGAEEECASGVFETRYLADKFDYGIPVSEFNGKMLKNMGYTCPMQVIPIVVPFDSYDQNCDSDIVRKFEDRKKNILFVGRIAPNKCQQDVIKAFYVYNKYFNKESRLFLVGSYKEDDKYYKSLKQYVLSLGLEEVYFTGHISFCQLVTYYSIADIFLCMSEHEGFCIPLLEAMYFQMPIISYSSSAVGETVGNAGVLLDDKNPVSVAEWIDKVLSNKELYNSLVRKGKERIQDFSYSITRDKVLSFFKDIQKGFE